MDMRVRGRLLLLSLTTILVLTALAEGLNAFVLDGGPSLAVLQAPGAMSALASAGVALAAALQRRARNRD